MICRQCGAQFEEGKYCPNCGSYMEEETVLSLEENEEQRIKNNAIRRNAIAEKRLNNKFSFLLGFVAAIVVIIILALGLG